MRRKIVGGRLTQLIGVAAQLGIADLLRHGPLSVEELAVASNADPRALYRALRLLASEGIFVEGKDRTFRLTPLAETLVTDGPGSLRLSAIFETSGINWQPWAHALRGVRTGRSTFEHAFGATMFEYLQQHPDAAALFDAFTVEKTSAIVVSIMEAYDFAGIATLADIGGGHGALVVSLLRAYPAMRGMLFDLPHVVSGADRTLAHAGVENRCDTVAGSFFETVSAGCQTYLLKSVLHDWSDERCVDILRNCHRAMPADGRVLVIEHELAAGNEPDDVRYVDMNMLIQTDGGYERTRTGYESLLVASGFRLTRIVHTSSGFNVFEARKASGSGLSSPIGA